MTDNFEVPGQTSDQGMNRETKKRKGITIIAGGIMVLLIVLIGFAKTVPYVEKPAFCQNCHAMKEYFVSWQDSPHNKTSCFGCHFSPVKKLKPNPKPVTKKQYWNINLGNKTINISSTMNKIKNFVIKTNTTIEVVKVNSKYNLEILGKAPQLVSMFLGGRSDGTDQTRRNCVTCHSDLAAGKSKNDSAGHKSHLSAGLTCQECHGNVAHEGSVRQKREDCVKCHSKGIPKPKSHKSALFTLSHGKSFLQKYSCRICHIQGSKQKVCMDCHGIEMPHREQYAEIHLDQIKLMGLKKCQVCHIEETKQRGAAVNSDRQAVKKKKELACARCHGNKLLHNRTKALPTHGQQSLKEGTKACYTCHKPADCTECHGGVQMPHPNNYLQQHAIAAKKGMDSCIKCHETQANKAPICIACHWMEMPHPQGYAEQHLKIELPDGCSYCHSPENPIVNSAARAVAESRPSRRECRNCH